MGDTLDNGGPEGLHGLALELWFCLVGNRVDKLKAGKQGDIAELYLY